MRVRGLRAHGWRNLAPLAWAIDPSAKLNVLHGDNGQGKTNILEALYYLATFRSFRTTRAADLVQMGTDQARIGVDLETRDLRRSVDVRLTLGAPEGSFGEVALPRRGAARAITVDAKAVRAVAAAFGTLSVVLFVPEDLFLVRAAPALRRRFLDMAICAVEPAYFGEASVFQRVLRSRNALLRGRRTAIAPELLDTYDEQLARSGARVVRRRRSLVEALTPSVQVLFQRLHADRPVTLVYQSDQTVDAVISEDEVMAALLDGLGQRRANDVRRGHTTFGPQTDDLEIGLDSRPAREHASQGQLRSLVLAMKLAELTYVEAQRGETPILLLDDVPSELDPTRRRFLFDTLGGLSCQTFASVADPAVVPVATDRADFRMQGGHLTALPVFALQTGT